MNARFASHPLVAALRGIGLPQGEYVVFGSAPLLAAGLRERIADLDVVASGHAWERIASAIPPQPALSGHGRMVRLQIEVVDRWLPGWDTHRLIDSAQTVAGVPLAPLSAVARSKTQTSRAKDLADLHRMALAEVAE